MKMLAGRIVAGLFAALLVFVPARAGDVKLVGHFENKGVVAEIDTYTDNAVTVGVIAFKADGRTLTYAFDSDDWPQLDRLWQSTVEKQGDDLKSVGVLPEVETSEKCVILAAGGPVVRLTIASPIDGSLTFEVPPWMVEEFGAKLREAASVTTPS